MFIRISSWFHPLCVLIVMTLGCVCVCVCSEKRGLCDWLCHHSYQCGMKFFSFQVYHFNYPFLNHQECCLLELFKNDLHLLLVSWYLYHWCDPFHISSMHAYLNCLCRQEFLITSLSHTFLTLKTCVTDLVCLFYVNYIFFATKLKFITFFPRLAPPRKTTAAGMIQTYAALCLKPCIFSRKF